MPAIRKAAAMGTQPRKPAASVRPASAISAPDADTHKRAAKRVLMVDLPSSAEGEDVEVAKCGPQKKPSFAQKKASFAAPRVYRDEDVEEAASTGWLSKPCDCFLSIWTTLGDVVEGGADQFIGMLLLLVSGAFTYMVSGGYRSLWTSAAGSGAGNGLAPPAPPAQPDWAWILMQKSHTYAQLYPAAFVGGLLGGLLGVGVLVLFEEDLYRVATDARLKMYGYEPLEKPTTPFPDEGNAALSKKQRAMRFMRERTLRQEVRLHSHPRITRA